jgi:hypothetical protein
MTPKGPRSERETVINFNAEDETATVWTASGPIERRLRKLGLEVIEEGNRLTVFKCLKSQVKVQRRRVLSPELLEAARENAMRLRLRGATSSRTTGARERLS